MEILPNIMSIKQKSKEKETIECMLAMVANFSVDCYIVPECWEIES